MFVALQTYYVYIFASTNDQERLPERIGVINRLPVEIAEAENLCERVGVVQSCRHDNMELKGKELQSKAVTCSPTPAPSLAAPSKVIMSSEEARFKAIGDKAQAIIDAERKESMAENAEKIREAKESAKIQEVERLERAANAKKVDASKGTPLFHDP